jgi:hypothetical protein
MLPCEGRCYHLVNFVLESSPTQNLMLSSGVMTWDDTTPPFYQSAAYNEITTDYFTAAGLLINTDRKG